MNGGYAEYAVNAAGGWMKVPNPVTWSPLEAASVMCTYGTVWHAAFTRGRCVGYIGDHTRHKCTHWLRAVTAPNRTSLSTIYPPIYRSNGINKQTPDFMKASGKETVLLSQYRHDSRVPLLEEHALVFTSPARLCLLWRGRVKAGERVLVTGASGGVGTSAVQMLSKLGCHVVAVTTSPAKVCVSMGDRAGTVYLKAACEFRQA